MKKGILCLLALALIAIFCGGVSADQNDDPDAWKTTVYGEDWRNEKEKLDLLVPELAGGQAITSVPADSNYVSAMPGELPVMISLAVENYYIRLEKIEQGYAGRKFIIVAARRVDDYMLLWLDEPEVRDGGRAIIYSGKKDKIVADFFAGGIKG